LERVNDGLRRIEVLDTMEVRRQKAQLTSAQVPPEIFRPKLHAPRRPFGGDDKNLATGAWVEPDARPDSAFLQTQERRHVGIDHGLEV
jgi:hypothetical protein